MACFLRGQGELACAGLNGDEWNTRLKHGSVVMMFKHRKSEFERVPQFVLYVLGTFGGKPLEIAAVVEAKVVFLELCSTHGGLWAVCFRVPEAQFRSKLHYCISANKGWWGLDLERVSTQLPFTLAVACFGVSIGSGIKDLGG